MKVPDHILADYFRLTTDIPETVYRNLLETDIRRAHLVYAREIVSIYHGEDSVISAEKRYHSIARGKAPDDTRTLAINVEKASIIELLKQAGLAASNSEGRRLIREGGIKLDGKTIGDPDLLVRNDVVISRGKNKFVRIQFNKGETNHETSIQSL
jgi:tyrosyl-tRNA synthetase